MSCHQSGRDDHPRLRHNGLDRLGNREWPILGETAICPRDEAGGTGELAKPTGKETRKARRSREQATRRSRKPYVQPDITADMIRAMAIKGAGPNLMNHTSFPTAALDDALRAALAALADDDDDDSGDDGDLDGVEDIDERDASDPESEAGIRAAGRWDDAVCVLEDG